MSNPYEMNIVPENNVAIVVGWFTGGIVFLAILYFVLKKLLKSNVWYTRNKDHVWTGVAILYLLTWGLWFMRGYF
jgi:hypothetical protein